MTNPSPKPCAEWADILTVTHPDDLSSSWRTALEAHLATCAACAAVRADYERLDRYIQRLPTSRPLPAFPPQLLADGMPQRATTRLEQSDGGYTSAPRLVPQKRIRDAARPSGRFKSALTIATLVVIVALFAVLMRNFATGHSSRPSQNGSPSRSSPATQATTTGQWETAAGLIDQSGLPVLAPAIPLLCMKTWRRRPRQPTSCCAAATMAGQAGILCLCPCRCLQASMIPAWR